MIRRSLVVVFVARCALAAAGPLDAPPVITGQPAGYSGCPGSNAVFTVVATGATSYQWRKDGTNLAGALGATLVVAVISAPNAGAYDCVVSNADGSTVSAVANLVVYAAPVIAVPPAPATACIGGSVTFSAVATGNPAPTFIWRRNGLWLASGPSPSYTVSPVNAGSVGSYTVEATNACGATSSPGAALTTVSPVTIVVNPQSATVCAGAFVALGAAATGTAPLAYQWRKNGTPLPGATLSTLSLGAASPTQAGVYDVVVSNACGSATSAAAVLTVNTPPVVATPPASIAACAGDAASFAVAATGSSTFAYQWRKNSVAIPGAVAPVYAVAAVGAADAGDYSCLVSNTCGAVVSPSATLVVAAGPALAGLAPAAIPVGGPLDPPVALTVSGSCFDASSTVVAAGTALPTTFVSATTLQAVLPAGHPATLVRGGLSVVVVGGSSVSNAVALVVGGGANQGTLRRDPPAAGPGDAFQAVAEGGVPLMPLSLLLDFGAGAPYWPIPTAGADLVLAVGPPTGSTGPVAALFDGLGLFGAPDGASFDAAGEFRSPTFFAPIPALGFVFTLQAIYADPSAPAGFRLTWAKAGEIF